MQNSVRFTVPGWENTIVTTGLKMLDFMKGNATMEDVIRQLDEDQDSVVNNTPDVITTVTEELSQNGKSRHCCRRREFLMI